jgi:hypothetical protein
MSKNMMGLISASWKIWLTFVPDGSAGGQQQNLVPEKTTETHMTELQIKYDVKFQNVTLQPNNPIQIISKRIFPLTHGL